MPTITLNPHQNVDMTLVSWFDTILSGIPCSLMISVIYKYVRYLEVKVTLMDNKCASLAKLSTIT